MHLPEHAREIRKRDVPYRWNNHALGLAFKLEAMKNLINDIIFVTSLVHAKEGQDENY